MGCHLTLCKNKRRFIFWLKTTPWSFQLSFTNLIITFPYQIGFFIVVSHPLERIQPNCLASTFGSPMTHFLHFKLLIYKAKLNSENAMLVCSSLPFNLCLPCWSRVPGKCSFQASGSLNCSSLTSPMYPTLHTWDIDMNLDVHRGRFQMVFYLLVLRTASHLLRGWGYSPLCRSASIVPPRLLVLCSGKKSGIEVTRPSLNPGISMVIHVGVADVGNRVSPLAFLLTKSPFCSGVWQSFFYLKEGGSSCYPRSGNYITQLWTMRWKRKSVGSPV